MYLMRENLRPLMHSLTTAHAGLLIQRTLPVWEEGEKPQKQALVNTIAAVKPDDVYNLAFRRWLKLTKESDNFATTSATINGRLFTGLPLGGTLETGVSTHHTYGMPLLAGSSIKGAVRYYAESIGIDKSVIQVLFGSDNDDAPDAGYLVWHDGWWIPNTNIQTPFAKDIVTVHHQQYYNGTRPVADDTESPTPNIQTAVQGSFYFAIEGVHAWVEYAKQLLENTLKEQGLGSKTASGYGYFIEDDMVSGKLNALYQKTLIDIEKAKAAQKLKEKISKAAQQLQEEISKASSAHEAALIQQIHDKKWRDSNDVVKTDFTKAIPNWLEILEATSGEQKCVSLFIEIAKIHYTNQMKNPSKARPNQQAWIERLLALENTK